MAAFKCKMCGGGIEVVEGKTIIECEYCGSLQTVPNADNEQKMALYTRANKLRRENEFDKASGVYENIVSNFPDEAEAYWGLVLCKYGIEYVDDPVTRKKIPTCHRSSFDSVMDDENFDLVMENADPIARGVYREEAKQIEEIRKGIIAISSREAPYDVFICYKETGLNGDRTIDSVRGQEIYDALTARGYKVFFSRITLEDKLGTAYEPYIFSALNSAKVMVVIGTDYEHFNAVWVKNEWSRFLKMMASDKTKHLIPCYENIDAYDMPKEFAHLQAQDMGKIGYLQDLVRGIEKLCARGGASAGTEALLSKLATELESKNWKNVQDICNGIIEKDPQCAMAYVYHLARMRRVTKIEDLGKSVTVLSGSDYYKKALLYADPSLKARLEAWNAQSEESFRLAVERCATPRERAKKLDGIISGGKEHTAALLTDGTVVACGSNQKGQISTGTWRNIVYIACGDFHTVGLKSDGTVVACGDNEKGQCNVSGWTDIVHISCDAFHTVGVRSDGTVVACGSNENGRCEVEGWTDGVLTACGYRHTVLQKKDGKLTAIGANGYKQCNVGDWTDIVWFAANNVHTIGAKRNGTVVACGDNEEGQTNVREWRDIIAVSCGTHHTVGLRADGTVVACGSDEQSRCSAVREWTDIVYVSCGAWNTLGVRADGTVVACGDKNGNKAAVENWKLFNDIDDIEEERIEARAKRRVRDIERSRVIKEAIQRQRLLSSILSGGENHTVGLITDGTTLSCGKNDKNQFISREWNSVVSVKCGGNHTVALLNHTSGQKLLCVGDNQYGQCNLPETPPKEVIELACGSKNSVLLYEDGTVCVAGDNSCDEKEAEEWRDIISVACGWNHIVGLRRDGTVLACGGNSKGQRNVENWTDIIMIAACNTHTVGLRSDGTVVAAGENVDGQGNVEGWRNIVAISCGSHHTVGLCADGTVVACGYDPDNRCEKARKWQDMVGVVCGSWTTMGIKADGTILTCGENTNGQRDMDGWRLFNDINTLEEDRRRKIKPSSKLPSDGGYRETDMRRKGPAIITNVYAIGTRDYNNMWPVGTPSRVFNYDDQYVIAFNISVARVRLSTRRQVKLGTVICNEQGRIIIDETVDLNWASNFDKLSKTFIIKGGDGSVVPTGKYHAEFWVDESASYGFDFVVTSNGEIAEKRKIQELKNNEMRPKWRAAGLCQHCGGTFKGLFTKTCAVCGKKKDY
ncbi:MAG: TIR domain-containing protein [Clostridia bacterium]|nr:TIR domain-containing protein [Clostridia bacterium]